MRYSSVQPIALCLLLTAQGCGDNLAAPGFTGADAAGSDGPSADAGSPDAAPPFGGLDVVFPPPRSRIDDNAVTVRGTADPGKFAAILVNGVAAQSQDGFENWQATVALDPGENVLTVDGEGIGGEALEALASMTVTVSSPMRLVAPEGVAFDPADATRVLVVDEDPGHIVSQSLTTGASRMVSENRAGLGPELDEPGDIAVDAEAGRALVIDSELEALVSVDLATGIRSIVANEDTGVGPELSLPRAVSIGANRDTAFVLTSRSLLQVTVDTGDRVEVSGPLVGTGPAMTSARDMVLDAPSNRALVVDSAANALLGIDLTTGDRSVVSDATTGTGELLINPYGIALDAAAGRAFVTTEIGLTSVDLTTGDRTVLSLVDPATGENVVGGGLIWERARRLVFDPTQGRVIVLDAAIESLLSVDVATGERAFPWNRDAGPWLRDVMSIAHDSANDRMLIADGGHIGLWSVSLADAAQDELASRFIGSGADLVAPLGVAVGSSRVVMINDITGTIPNPTSPVNQLLDVDLTTGARTVIGPPIDGATNFGLAITTDDRAIISSLRTDCGDAIVAIDLTTGTHTDITRNGADPGQCALADVGTGPALEFPGPLAVDEAGGRVLVTDNGARTVFAVDLATGDRSILSDASTGSGPMFSSARGIALDVPGNRALVFDPQSDALFGIDLSTGDRQILASASIGNGPALFAISLELVDPRGVAVLLDSLLEAAVVLDTVTGDRVVLRP